MKPSTSPAPSRLSSSTVVSKTTAHDLPHTGSSLHHHDHKNFSSADQETVKMPDDDYTHDRKESHERGDDNPSEPIRIFTLTASDSNHTHQDDEYSEKRSSLHSHRHHHQHSDGEDPYCKQLPDETGGQSNLGRLCSWADLPPWMKDNPAILTGYRRPTFSYRQALISLGYLHNESVNIWSHLLGAVAFLIVAPISYFKIIGVMETIHWTDIAVFYAFLAGAIICLSMSASFHTFCCHSEGVSSQWNRCDYVGIVFLIVGSFYPAIFYAFYCHQTFQIMYIAMISTFGAATIVVVLRPKFRTPQFRWVRSGLFLAMGLSGLFPVVHGIILYGFAMAQRAIALNYMFCMGAAYVLGALIYGSRVPECWFPGKFDNFAASHQIFHICVLIGCAVHFLGVTKAMAFWHNIDHSCTIPLDQIRSQFVS
ncbi:adiponectin receptor [Entomortierella parvispora]|uniref:Adiponectin receptor n=1 Tax=Entomortierella parvispora TaxID=205924 RepID=A0A9P3HB29_9FUNG|nr:adiponectin receptor [Entomortierella parvispora]